MTEWQRLIRDIPDFPKPGIVFKDIMPMLADAQAFASAIDVLAARALAEQLDAQVVGAGVLLEIGALAGRSRWGDAVPLHAALTL